MHGGRDAMTDAAKLLRGTPAEAPAQRLASLFEAACDRGIAERADLTVDLGEVRGFAYYTGTIFHVYAGGPGEAIGAGGRYDELLARFGAPMPAVGFAIDLDGLTWALRDAGALATAEARVVVVGTPEDPRLRELRAEGVVAVAVASRDAARDYAEKWGYVVDEPDLERRTNTARADKGA
jgi:ATP phosphoribosyltransferase regulatory subunit